VSKEDVWESVIEKLDNAKIIKKEETTADESENETKTKLEIEKITNNTYILELSDGGSDPDNLEEELLKLGCEEGDIVFLKSGSSEISQIIHIIEIKETEYSYEYIDIFEPPIYLEIMTDYLEGDSDSED
jgi:hypothetical protein